MLRIPRGFTLVEIAIVLLIVAILAALLFPLAAGAREKSRQAVCVSNLRQIQTALQLYFVDQPEPAQWPLVGPPRPALWEYLSSREVLYCPDMPDAFKQVVGSSYQYHWDLWPPKNKEESALFRSLREERLERLGDKYPLVSCRIHDEVFYLPQERHIDPRYALPFVIELRLDGSIVSGRFDHPRGGLFEYWSMLKNLKRDRGN